MYFAASDFTLPNRHNAWRDIVHATCGQFTTHFGSNAPNGTIETAQIGTLACAKISQSVERVCRARTEVMADETNHCYLLLQTAGCSKLIHDDISVDLAPGDAVLIDSAAPFEMSMAGHTSQICVHVPKDRLAAEMAGWEKRLGRKLPTPNDFLLQSIITAAFMPGDGVDEGSGEVLANAVVGLLSQGWCNVDDPKPASQRYASRRLRHVRNFILNNLSEGDLSPKMIARATAISERQLHRLFSSGPSLSQWIRQARVERCAADFRDPSLYDRSITEIAYARGFNDSAHFSRVFRDAFGVPPREYRKQVAYASRPSQDQIGALARASTRRAKPSVTGSMNSPSSDVAPCPSAAACS